MPFTRMKTVEQQGKWSWEATSRNSNKNTRRTQACGTEIHPLAIKLARESIMAHRLDISLGPAICEQRRVTSTINHCWLLMINNGYQHNQQWLIMINDCNQQYLLLLNLLGGYPYFSGTIIPCILRKPPPFKAAACCLVSCLYANKSVR